MVPVNALLALFVSQLSGNHPDSASLAWLVPYMVVLGSGTLTATLLSRKR